MQYFANNDAKGRNTNPYELIAGAEFACDKRLNERKSNLSGKIAWVSLVAFLSGATGTTVAQQPSHEFRLRDGAFGSGQIPTKKGDSLAFFPIGCEL
jgi:hypothetical protein